MVAKILVNFDQIIGKIHPHIYGHFIEHLGRCIYGGIWAEMLKNRKFFSQYGDGVVRWVDSKEEGILDPWFSIGRNENTYFTHDNTVFYSGNQSQRVDIKKTDGQEHGIGQAGMVVQKKREYAGRVVIKWQSGAVSECQSPIKINVRLRDGEKNLAPSDKEIELKEKDWHTYHFKLKPDADCLDAKFCITSTNAGTLWFGAVSLIPQDNIYGMRRDTLELIKQIKPPIVRWPGGNFASGYHWKDGIGDSDRRPTRWDYTWNALEYNDFGTDEYMQFCKEVGCEPLICINAGSPGTIKEAADWVKYCKEKSKKFLPVKYWDIGNEMYGNWQLGHIDSETFAHRSLKFIKAMRKIDPKIKVVGCGVPVDSYNHWNDPLIKIAGKELDYLSVHDYTGSGSKDENYLYNFIVSAPVRIEKVLQDTIDYINKLSPDKKIPLAFDEWNVWLPEANLATGLEMPYKLRDAIYAAGVFHTMHRLADDVKMANLAQLVNVLGAIYTDPARAITTSLHIAFKLYVNHTGEEALKVESESPVFDVVNTEGVTEFKGIPYIDCSATISPATKTGGQATLHIAVINRHPSEEIECQISLKSFPPVTAAGGKRGIAFQMNAENFASRETTISEFTMSGLSSCFTQKFPPHSVTIIEMEA